MDGVETGLWSSVATNVLGRGKQFATWLVVEASSREAALELIRRIAVESGSSSIVGIHARAVVERGGVSSGVGGVSACTLDPCPTRERYAAADGTWRDPSGASYARWDREAAACPVRLLWSMGLVSCAPGR